IQGLAPKDVPSLFGNWWRLDSHSKSPFGWIELLKSFLVLKARRRRNSRPLGVGTPEYSKLVERVFLQPSPAIACDSAFSFRSFYLIRLESPKSGVYGGQRIGAVATEIESSFKKVIANLGCGYEAARNSRQFQGVLNGFCKTAHLAGQSLQLRLIVR